jgi:uncharacterized OB-fold protein
VSQTPDITEIIRQYGGDPVVDLPFWEACRDGKFLLHRCARCNRHYWPATRCIEHGAEAMGWVESAGKGEVYTYTIVHHAYTPAMKGKTPYAVAVVKLDEGPFYHTNIIDCPPDKVAVGMRVQATMIPHETGLTIPVFRPA